MLKRLIVFVHIDLDSTEPVKSWIVNCNIQLRGQDGGGGGGGGPGERQNWY